MKVILLAITAAVWAGVAAPAALAQQFKPATTYSVLGTGSSADAKPQGIAVADFNRDGQLDLVVANSYQNTLAVLAGQPATPGTYAAATTYASGGIFPVSVVVADFNGDGLPDLATTNQTSNTVAVLLNLAAQPGSFAVAATYGCGGTGPRGLATADFNGDGRPDLAVSNITSSSVSVLLGSSATAGALLAPSIYPAGQSTEYVAVGDLNGDGQPDLVASAQKSNGVAVLLNAGSGAGGLMQAAVLYGSGGVDPRGVAVADVNGDGRPDIVAANYTSNTVGVLLNSAAAPGTFPGGAAGYLGAVIGPVGIAVGDVTGDGQPDIVLAGYQGGAGSVVSVLPNAAAAPGTYPTAVTYASGGAGPHDLALRDLNGDGQLDIATTNYGANTLGILLSSRGPLATAQAAQLANEVVLYPNPAHEGFTVKAVSLPGGSPMQLEVLNALGQIVRQQASAAGALLQVPTTGLAPGVYTVQLRTANTLHTRSVVLY